MAPGLTEGSAGPAGAGPALAVSRLTKSFSGTVALSSFDLEVSPGEVHALVGENGSGKSTFIKILAGYHRPDPGGEVRIDGTRLPPGAADTAHAMGCRFVHQDLGLVLDLSIVDNLFLNRGFSSTFGTIRGGDTRRRASVLLARVGLDVDPRTAVRELSPAQRTGVAVARALEGHADHQVKLLVLDEPTATLPDHEVGQLLAIIRRVAADGIGVLYVSHRLDEIFQIADNVTVLRDGRKVTTVAVSSLDKRALIRLLVGDELDETRAASASAARGGGDVILTVRDLQGPALASVSIEARRGDIIGFAGITGSGREALLGSIFGAHPRMAGTVQVADRPIRAYDPRAAIASGMAYLPPDRRVSGGVMSLSARENLTMSNVSSFWKPPLLRRGLERREVRSWFERLSVRPAKATEAPLENFSGGNQQKVLFAKWLRLAPQVLLLDEPTQGVDVGAKADLHRHLLEAASGGAAVLVSSSDVEELVALCPRVMVMRSGRIVADLHGDAVTAARISRASLGAEQEAVPA